MPVFSSLVSSPNLEQNRNVRASKTPTDDSLYLDSISQYQNEPYYDYLLRNPWLFSKQAAFSPTFFQSVAEGFGDYSARDRYYADLQSQQQQWLSESLEKFRQEDYNSAAQQVVRERAAGLNPDLNGEVTAGSAAENDQPMQAPVSMDQGDSDVVKRISSGAMQFLSFILTAGKSLQDLNLGQESVVSNELANNSAAMQFVMNHRALSSKYKDYSIPQFDAVSDDEIIAAVKEAPLEGYSRRTRKYLNRFFSTLKPDSLAVQSIRENLRTQIAEAREKRASIEGSPIYDDDFQSWVNNYARKVGDVEYTVWKLQQRAAAKGWSAEYLNNKIQEITNEATADMYDFVRGGHKWYNTMGIIGLPFIGNALGSGLNIGMDFLSKRALKRMPNIINSTSNSTSNSISHVFSHKVR